VRRSAKTKFLSALYLKWRKKRVGLRYQWLLKSIQCLLAISSHAGLLLHAERPTHFTTVTRSPALSYGSGPKQYIDSLQCYFIRRLHCVQTGANYMRYSRLSPANFTHLSRPIPQ